MAARGQAVPAPAGTVRPRKKRKIPDAWGAAAPSTPGADRSAERSCADPAFADESELRALAARRPDALQLEPAAAGQRESVLQSVAPPEAQPRLMAHSALLPKARAAEAVVRARHR